MPEAKPGDRPVTIDDEGLISLIDRFYQEAKSARTNWDANWNLYQGAFIDENLWPANMPNLRTKMSAPKMRRIIYHKAGLLLYNKPKIVVEPMGDGASREGAEQLQRRLDSIEYDQNEPLKRIQNMIFKAIYGIGNKKIWYDPWDNPPFGRIRTGTINPVHIFPDPNATSMEDARYLIYARVCSIEDIHARYGVWVNPDNSYSTYNEEEKKSLATSEYANQALSFTGKGRTLVIECWWKDPTTINEKIKIDGKSFDIRKKKYPFGRLTVIASKKILFDGESQYKRSQHIVSQYYPVPFRWCGIGEIQNLLYLQLDVNKGLSSVSDNRNLTSNSTWVTDSNSGVEPYMITNQAGLVIVKNPGTTLDRVPPPSLPGYILEYISQNEERMEDLAGLTDLRIVRKPSTHTAGQAIENEQLSGFVSVRLQLQIEEQAIEDEGELKIEMIRRHPQPGTFIAPDETGRMQEYTWDPLLTKEGNYRVRVGHGSTLPVSRTSRRNDAMSLYQAGVLDKEEVLYIMDVPDRDQILERMEEREAALAQKSEASGISPDKFSQPSKGKLPAGALNP